MINPKNSFNLLRIIAAMFVLISHQYALNNLPEPLISPKYSFGTFGVGIFFMLSGFLLINSWLSKRNIILFFVSRLVRIVPGLTASVIFSMLIIGPIFTSCALIEYFSSAETYAYLMNIFFVSKYVLPGVFANNLYPDVVNGSLWTLPFELFCYFTLMLIGIFLKKEKNSYVYLLCSTVICFFTVSSMSDGYQRYWRYLELIFFFYSGVVLYFTVISERSKKIKIILLLLLLLYVSIHNAELFIIQMIVIATVLLFYKIEIMNKFLSKIGDLSFGLYVYAFPVQQIVVNLTHENLGIVLQIVCSMIIVSLISWFSWWLIELPALKLKKIIYFKSM